MQLPLMPSFWRALRRILTVGGCGIAMLLVLLVMYPAGIVRDWLIVGVHVWMTANLCLALACYVVDQTEPHA